MALPVRPSNPSNPIPNNPFYAPESISLVGAYGPLTVGSGLAVNYSVGVIFTTGGGAGTVLSLTAGPGIQLTPSLITSTGSITLSNSGVTAGTYTYPTIGVDSFGRITFASNGNVPSTTVVAPITNTGTSVNPVIGIQLATTGQLGVVQVGGNINVSSGVISVAPASTTVAGVVRLNDTVVSTSTTQALTAAQGKELQDQISAVTTSGGATLAGTFDAATSQMLTVTASGTGAGFAIGSDLPASASGNTDFFVLVRTGGSYNPPGGGGPYTASQGDWFLSNGLSWEFMNFGVDFPVASTSVAGIVELATNVETLTGTDTSLSVAPAGAFSTYLGKTTLTAKGAIVSASGTSVPSTLSVATDNQVLSACSATTTGLCWIDNPNALAIPCSAVADKGSLIAGTGAATFTALPVGVNGQILVVDAACTSGLKWRNADLTVVATPTGSGKMCGCTNTSSTALGSNARLGVTANVSIGVNAGGSDSSNNVALGARAGGCLTTGSSNTLIGCGAGAFMTTGVCNTLIGARAGASPNGGPCNDNILIGVSAGCSAGTTFTNTIFIGNNAGDNCTFSDCNLYIGHDTKTSFGQGGKNIAIGHGLRFGGTQNGVRIGKGGNACADFLLDCGAPLGWQFSSDARLKDKVTALQVNAEAFINDLRPVTYCFLDQETKQPLEAKHCNAGFIAQEVEQVMENHGIAEITSLVTKPWREDEYYRVSETGFTPFVVKALQELFAKMTVLEAKYEAKQVKK